MCLLCKQNHSCKNERVVCHRIFTLCGGVGGKLNPPTRLYHPSPMRKENINFARHRPSRADRSFLSLLSPTTLKTPQKINFKKLKDIRLNVSNITNGIFYIRLNGNTIISPSEIPVFDLIFLFVCLFLFGHVLVRFGL